MHVSDLAQKIQQVSQNLLRFGDFESWFRDASRDLDLSDDRALGEAIDTLEDVFSQYHYEGLRGEQLASELASAIRVNRLNELSADTFAPADHTPDSQYYRMESVD